MKKIAFVAVVLFSSLLLLQYVLIQGILSAETTAPQQVNQEEVMQPVRDQMFSTGDYIVVLKDGKYYVYKKRLPST